MSFRIEKVSKLIKEEISLIFLYKLKDPAFGLITITNVKVSPDLRVAKIYFSVFDKEKRQLALEKMNEAKAFIRSELAQRIKIRFVPELDFYIDDTIDHVEKIEGILKKLHENDNQNNN
jgi:ribosome-binding factor A